MPVDCRPLAIAVMGPTASGKTAFAVELARHTGFLSDGLIRELRARSPEFDALAPCRPASRLAGEGG